MIKKLLTSAITILAISANAQSFTLMYPFTAVMSGTASTGTTDPTPPPTATGVTGGSFTAVGTSTNPSTGGVFSFSGWDVGTTNGNDVYSTMTGTLNPSKYYDVSLTPTSGMSISLTNIAFNVNRSGTGPRTWAVRSNRDAFAANLPASVITNTNLSIQATNVLMWSIDSYTTNIQQRGSVINLSGSSFTNQTTPYNFRFYFYNAEGTPGTFRIDTVVFIGTATLATGLGSVKFDLNSNFNIYPVPSNDGVVFIENQNATEISKIEVIDVLGNIVLTNATTNDTKVKLNLATVPSGSYFVRITSGKNTSVKRIMISK